MPAWNGSSGWLNYPYSTANIAADADWILTCQLVDGGICTYSDKAGIVPYFSNLASLGLSRATQVTGTSSYAAAAWNWLDWYASKMDATTGYVTDYTVAPVTQALTSSGDFDSTDSYAATFLHAAWRNWKVTGDTTRLTGLNTACGRAMTAIESTQQADGLTYAKPSYQIKYALDNAEVYAGAQAAYAIGGALSNATLQSRALACSNAVVSGFETLWMTANQSYAYAKDAVGGLGACNWANLYPDAWAQVWPVAFGLISGQRAIDLVNEFQARHPLWDAPGNAAPLPGWAFLQVGQLNRSQRAAARIRATTISGGRVYPYIPALAGEQILLESSDSEYLPPKVGN